MMSRNLPSSHPKVLLIGSCLSENLVLRIQAWLKREKKDPTSVHHLLVFCES